FSVACSPSADRRNRLLAASRQCEMVAGRVPSTSHLREGTPWLTTARHHSGVLFNVGWVIIESHFQLHPFTADAEWTQRPLRSRSSRRSPGAGADDEGHCHPGAFALGVLCRTGPDGSGGSFRAKSPKPSQFDCRQRATSLEGLRNVPGRRRLAPRHRILWAGNSALAWKPCLRPNP